MDREKHYSDRWGFWIPIKDLDSAQHATRMSSFLVFLMGLSFIGQAMFFTSNQLYILGGIFTLAGLFLTISAFMIRKNRITTLPFVIGLWLLLTLVNILITYSRAGPTTLFVTSLVWTGIISLLAISGLRGWWWLRTHPD